YKAYKYEEDEKHIDRGQIGSGDGRKPNRWVEPPGCVHKPCQPCVQKSWQTIPQDFVPSKGQCSPTLAGALRRARMHNPGYSWRLRASRRMIGKLPRRGRTFHVMAQAPFYHN
ncbi:MAG: hypothetical protein V3U27_22550, partial [Candidatus Tectomicrobia bacterium]